MGGLDLFQSVAPASPEGAWTVAQVTNRARQIVEAGFDRLWVHGEVTSFKSYQSGHWYFTLRDAAAQIRCVMWKADARAVRAKIEDGMQVFVEARPTVWEERGEFRLTVKQMLPTEAGGMWQLQLERAKAALQKDGLLDPARKRPLPRYPTRLGVVTSPDGAALRDIVSVLRRRWPQVEVFLVPARVQGETAEDELCAALGLVNRIGADVVIVGRGGGSREDLWAFNSERVARAVAAVTVPTISAVGHETDISLTDLVADVRAATPSAAAEAAVPDREATIDALDHTARRLARTLVGRVELAGQRLDRTGDRLHQSLGTRLQRASSKLDALAAGLDAMSPLKVLGRGYAVARDEAGRVLKRVADFTPAMPFRLTVSDGDVAARVREGSG